MSGARAGFAAPFDGLLGAPPPLVRALLAKSELAELLRGTCEALGVRGDIADADGVIVAYGQGADPDDASVARPIRCVGEVVGTVRLAGPQAEAGARWLVSAIEVAAHHAFGRTLASTVHVAALEGSVDELREHGARLERAMQRVQDADRVKSNFLATMSHELRTPLTSVIGYAEMMAEGLAGPITSNQRDHLATILAKSDQLLQLINALLELGQLDAGLVGPSAARVDLRELVGAVAGAGDGVSPRRVEVTIAAPSCVVVGDRRQLRQVLQHLVSNALKFTPADSAVAIDVSAGPLRPGEADSPPGLHVRVIDRGIGIPPGILSRVFDPFFQADSSSTRAYGGSGLGLTLAKAFVELHGGRIWAASTPGEGSTFVVTLPQPRGDEA